MEDGGGGGAGEDQRQPGGRPHRHHRPPVPLHLLPDLPAGPQSAPSPPGQRQVLSMLQLTDLHLTDARPDISNLMP